MQLHLVDATYELFRAHYAPRPPVLGRDGRRAVGGVRPVRPAPVPAAGGGRDPRRLCHRPRHRVVPQRPLRGLQVVGRDAPRAALPVPHRRGRGRGAGHRPVADGRVRGGRRDRRRGRALRGRSTRRADPHLHARQGHGPARHRRARRALGPSAWPDLRRRRRARQVGRAAGLDPRLPGASSATRPTATRASPAGARRAPPRSWPRTATSRTCRPRRRPGRCRASAAVGR